MGDVVFSFCIVFTLQTSMSVPHHRAVTVAGTASTRRVALLATVMTSLATRAVTVAQVLAS